MSAIAPTNTQTTENLFASSIQGSALGKEDFLKLLVSQMQNQDPLNPSDPTEFTAQLAQFSSLEQLTNISNGLEKMASSRDLGALSFIGRDVIAEQTGFHLGEGPVRLGYRLDSPAEEVTVFVRDNLDRTVARIPGTELGAGEHFLTWDGRDSNGQALPPGDYKLMVSALDGQEEAVDSTALVKARVGGVDLDHSGYLLRTDAGNFALNSVKSVRDR